MSIPDRLKSRKFWVAVGAFVTFVANQQWTEAMGVVIAYLGLQGVQDTFKPSDTSPMTEIPTSQNDEVDTTQVVTGNTPLFNEELKDED